MLKNLLTTYDCKSAGTSSLMSVRGAEVMNSRKNPTIFLLNKNKNLIFAADLEENRISRNKQVINDKETIL